ncbi:MAG: hypothetical protein RR584_13355 [Comamonas sp.]
MAEASLAFSACKRNAIGIVHEHVIQHSGLKRIDLGALRQNKGQRHVWHCESDACG